jgi:8-oxo-dGTP pyrophosphatase MutT (NUDIX family)
MAEARQFNSFQEFDAHLSEMPVKKSGFVIYGDAVAPSKGFNLLRSRSQQKLERYVLAAWNEGRFADRDVGYQLPKGSVDKDEIPAFLEEIRKEYSAVDSVRLSEAIKQSSLATEQIETAIAGLRESKEETGIDVVAMLGIDNMEKLLRGEILENIESAWNQGDHPVVNQLPDIRIARVGLLPLSDFGSINRDGTPLRTQVFGMKLADGEITKLKNLSHLIKNNAAVNPHNPSQVSAPVADMRDGHHLPSDADILQWLRTGMIPEPADWTKPHPNGSLLTDLDKILRDNKDGSYDNHDGNYFRALEAKVFPDVQKILVERGLRKPRDTKPEIKNFAELGVFYQYLADTPEYANDHAAIHKMAKQMQKACVKLGVLQGDTGVLKMDTHDTPGLIYSEGADIIPLRNFFRDAIALGQKSIAYDLVMVGGRITNQLGAVMIDPELEQRPSAKGEIIYQKLKHSQMGALTAIAREDDVKIPSTNNITYVTLYNTALDRLRSERNTLDNAKKPQPSAFTDRGRGETESRDVG